MYNLAMTLLDLKDMESGIIQEIDGQRDVKRRLLEMGFCRGTVVKKIREAPMGDPVQYNLRGYHILLRKEQAKLISLRS